MAGTDLAIELDRGGIGYLIHDNYFMHIDDFIRAQTIGDQQRSIDRPGQLEALAGHVRGGLAGTPIR
jgi:hypothetical protein